MKGTIIGLVCAVSVLALVPTGFGAIKITRINFDSPGSDTGSNASLNAEWIRISNTGSTARKLGGWRIRDVAGHVYVFAPAAKIGAGKTITVHTGRGSNTVAHKYWRSDWYIWNNDGDTARLRNKAGSVVDVCSYSGAGSAVSC